MSGDCFNNIVGTEVFSDDEIDWAIEMAMPYLPDEMEDNVGSTCETLINMGVYISDEYPTLVAELQEHSANLLESLYESGGEDELNGCIDAMEWCAQSEETYSQTSFESNGILLAFMKDQAAEIIEAGNPQPSPSF